LARVDKKDATLKMAKLLIYQGPSALFEIFFKDFLGIGGQFVEIKELTKKMQP
jgi:hypothetical protein